MIAASMSRSFQDFRPASLGSSSCSNIDLSPFPTIVCGEWFEFSPSTLCQSNLTEMFTLGLPMESKEPQRQVCLSQIAKMQPHNARLERDNAAPQDSVPRSRLLREHTNVSK